MLDNRKNYGYTFYKDKKTKEKFMKKYLSFIVATLLLVCCFASCDKKPNNETVTEEFYTSVVKSQKLLDIYADDIYINWYDAIYNNKFGGSIDWAIARAYSDNEENIKILEENDAVIKTQYKIARDGKFSDNVKAVMSAYSDYYEFVVNVSGSFNSYSAEKETKKKALASELKKLQLEL